jgi:hypothetical protein
MSSHSLFNVSSIDIALSTCASIHSSVIAAVALLKYIYHQTAICCHFSADLLYSFIHLKKSLQSTSSPDSLCMRMYIHETHLVSSFSFSHSSLFHSLNFFSFNLLFADTSITKIFSSFQNFSIYDHSAISILSSCLSFHFSIISVHQYVSIHAHNNIFTILFLIKFQILLFVIFHFLFNFFSIHSQIFLSHASTARYIHFNKSHIAFVPDIIVSFRCFHAFTIDSHDCFEISLDVFTICHIRL